MPITETDGPYQGWMRWQPRGDGRFAEAALGPFFFRDEPDGRSVRCIIETGIQHTNGADFLHGGFIMSYADMVYFAIAWRSLEDTLAVTLTANYEFVGAGRAGVPLEAVGEIIKETGKLIFVRALLSQGDVPVCMTTATLRKISPRPKSAR
jgi:acyl-coenzyme A thioesterase PaaI-like protein